MAIRHVVVTVGLAFALAGCGAVGAIDIFKRRDSQPQPLPPPPIGQSATAPVDPSLLPPLGDDTQVAGLPPSQQPLPPPGGTTAAPVPTAGIGRTDLLGGWTITSGTDSCQLFMTLTSWTGGYRATTRGCNSAFLKSIAAWNLSGTQVVFAGMAGTAIAHLQSSGLNRFDGTADGQGGVAVSFFR